MSTNRSILCALVHECIKDSEIMTANFLNTIQQNIVNKCLLKNVNYVHPINVQTVETVHTYWLYAGKMMGPPCDPSVHDVIWLHRLPRDLQKQIVKELDSFTFPLHIPNGRHLPAVGLCKGTVPGVWKSVGIPTGHVNP